MANDFEDAWPDVIVSGFGVLRTAFRTAANDDDKIGVKWALLPGLMEDGPTMLVIGDLTSRSLTHFAGVQAYAYLQVRGRDAFTDDDWPEANSLLQLHAGWITHGLYDFAAQAMRAMTAGLDFHGLEVPQRTPEFTLRFVTGNDDD